MLEKIGGGVFGVVVKLVDQNHIRAHLLQHRRDPARARAACLQFVHKATGLFCKQRRVIGRKAQRLVARGFIRHRLAGTEHKRHPQ